MSDPIAALERIVYAVGEDLRAVMIARAGAAAAAPRATPTKPIASPQVALTRAVANIETLVTLVRANPTFLGTPQTSTVEKLEAQYGNTLGRIIAAVGGLPMTTVRRTDALTRLIASDPTVRAELARLDTKDGELLEVLFAIFVSDPAPAKPRAAASSDEPTSYGTATPHDTDHMAQLIAERAQYVIPSIIPPAAIADETTEAEEDEHVDRIRRVDPIDRSKRQK